MTSPPDVSVVIPTQNRAAVLERAVSSALRQDSPLEIMIVDDASTDETAAVIDSLNRNDDRVRSLRLKSAHGAAAARNRGIAAARGRFIGFLDDDDEWLPHKLDRQLVDMQRAGPDVGVCYGPHLQIWSDGRTQYVSAGDLSGADPLRKLVRGAFIGTPALLVRRECLERVGGFDSSLPRLQDWDLAMRLARVTRFVFSPEPVYHAHYTAGGISRRDERLREACRIIREKAAGWPELSKGGRADLDATLGHLLMAGNQPRVARRYYRQSLQSAPFQPRRWLMATLAHLWPGAYGAVATVHGRVAERLWRRQDRAAQGRS